MRGGVKAEKLLSTVLCERHAPVDTTHARLRLVPIMFNALSSSFQATSFQVTLSSSGAKHV